ncbi:MAG TPA: hypothetical protein VK987_10175 [Anaerolineae bacterium]|nr:hypothetical protein [Anaerolineae bacterium]
MPRTELAVWLALVVALVGLLQTGTPPRVAVLSLIVVAITLAISLRWRVAGSAVGVLLLVGMALRMAPASGFSDVLVVTEAAIREMLAGGNPYGHGYAESLPPGAPFAYGPLALLWYLPSLDEPQRLELLAAMVVLILLAVRGRPLGLAVYAVTPAFVDSATDGANDTTAGLLILAALLVAVRAPLAGAVLLAVAVAFKPYALAWLPGLIAYAGAIGPLLAFLAASAVLWLPAVLAWGPGSLLWSFREADGLHARPYYSLAYGIDAPAEVPKGAWNVFRIVVGLLLAVLSLVWVRSATSLVIAGTLVFAAVLFLGWWGTFAYLAAVAPVLCWHLDDWLGLGGQRVIWPTDPVRTVTSVVDSRWPVLRPGGGVIEAQRRFG